MTMCEWCDHVWLKALEGYARCCFDGHFTVLRFTTNVRVMVGTPNDRADIDNAMDGCSISVAIEKLLWNHVRAADMDNKTKDHAQSYLTAANQMIAKHRSRCRTP